MNADATLVGQEKTVMNVLLKPAANKGPVHKLLSANAKKDGLANFVK